MEFKQLYLAEICGCAKSHRSVQVNDLYKHENNMKVEIRKVEKRKKERKKEKKKVRKKERKKRK